MTQSESRSNIRGTACGGEIFLNVNTYVCMYIFKVQEYQFKNTPTTFLVLSHWQTKKLDLELFTYMHI